MADDPFRYFRVEAHELLLELTQGMLRLEKGAPTAVTTAELLRHAHTLKGAARVVRLPEIADLAHHVEEELDPFRGSSDPIPRDQIEEVLRLLDRMAEQVGALELPSDGSGTVPDASRAQPEAPRTLRAELGEVDAMLDGVEEAYTCLGALKSEVRELGRARKLVDDIVLRLAPGEGRSAHGAEPPVDAVVRSAAGELQGLIARLQRGLDGNVALLDRELRETRDAVERLRLVPAAVMFPDLERAARDVARAQGKRVVLDGRGGDVRLDSHVVTAARAALHQLVRNAVAHGIEEEGARLSAGKPPEGMVTVQVVRRGRRVVFTCQDDGRGIDLAAVREAARRRGLLDGATAPLDSARLTELLLRGGISTSGSVTELSGRGIGLDMARDAAVRLGGQISVVTEAGQGTTVMFEVPLLLASFDALAVAAGGATALVPLEAVVQTLRIGPEDTHVGPQGEALTFDGRVVPLLPLSEVLGEQMATTRVDDARSVVVVRGGAAVVAVDVDRLLGVRTIVVRPLPEFIPSPPVVSGVWLDEEGNPQLVLDVEGIVSEAQRERVRELGDGQPALAPILVVDDSLTTRMLEQSILESAGYAVEVASSAEEAVVKAQGKQYLLFLVDVEMPGMDGFSFVELAKADPTLRDVPAILVTSRAAPEDRQRGLAAGASAYITKGAFDQGELLGHIRALTGR